jgi:hypothetical protein
MRQLGKVYKMRLALNNGFAGPENAAESSRTAHLGTSTSRSPQNRHPLMSTRTFVPLWLPDVPLLYFPANMWLTSASRRRVISLIDSIPRKMVAMDFHHRREP